MQSLFQSTPCLDYVFRGLICALKRTNVKTEGQIIPCVSDVDPLMLILVEVTVEEQNHRGFEFF